MAELREIVRGEVSLVDHLDYLAVSPAVPASKFELIERLRRLVGPVSFRDGSVVVRAEHTPKLLNADSSLDLRWSNAAQRFAENRRRAYAGHERSLQAVEEIKRLGRDHARTLVRDLDDAEILDAHQMVNVAAMTVPASVGLCVFDEQGAGKTVSLIFGFDLLVKRREAELVLVVAPKSMVPEWPKDLRRFKGDMYRSEMLVGPRRAKLGALGRQPEFLVTNFETAVSFENELTALLRSLDGKAILAVDESFYVKNLDAARTRALRRLREWCDRAFVLCGTPAPNSPHDLIQQFSLVDFGVTFERVVVPEDRDAARPVVQSAVAERGLYVRHLKQEVLPSLPGKSFEKVLLPLAPVQRQLYDAAVNSLVQDLRSVDDATFNKNIGSFLGRRMALLQICSHPGMVAGVYVETPVKHVALDEILRDLIDRRSEKVVLWSVFRHSLRELFARYGHYGAVRYDGSVTTVEERREAVRRFQEDDDTKLFIGNPAAAGAGLTLHRSRVAVYESLSNQAAHYLQSLDRIHRRGQERPVEYLVLLGDRTLETSEYSALLRKEASAQELLGDSVNPPPTRERMLAELLAGAEGVSL